MANGRAVAVKVIKMNTKASVKSLFTEVAAMEACRGVDHIMQVGRQAPSLLAVDVQVNSQPLTSVGSQKDSWDGHAASGMGVAEQLRPVSPLLKGLISQLFAGVGYQRVHSLATWQPFCSEFGLCQ
jgi:hypothetical protein